MHGRFGSDGAAAFFHALRLADRLARKPVDKSDGIGEHGLFDRLEHRIKGHRFRDLCHGSEICDLAAFRKAPAFESIGVCIVLRLFRIFIGTGKRSALLRRIRVKDFRAVDIRHGVYRFLCGTADKQQCKTQGR